MPDFTLFNPFLPSEFSYCFCVEKLSTQRFFFKRVSLTTARSLQEFYPSHKTPVLPVMVDTYPTRLAMSMCWNYLLTTDPSKASVWPGARILTTNYMILYARSLQLPCHSCWGTKTDVHLGVIGTSSCQQYPTHAWKSRVERAWGWPVDYSPTNLFELELIKEVCASLLSMYLHT